MPMPRRRHQAARRARASPAYHYQAQPCGALMIFCVLFYLVSDRSESLSAFINFRDHHRTAPPQAETSIFLPFLGKCSLHDGALYSPVKDAD